MLGNLDLQSEEIRVVRKPGRILVGPQGQATHSSRPSTGSCPLCPAHTARQPLPLGRRLGRLQGHQGVSRADMLGCARSAKGPQGAEDPAHQGRR